jgi:hypothetical protein
MNSFNEKKLPIVTEESEHQMTLCQKIAKHQFVKITVTNTYGKSIHLEIFDKTSLT